MSGWSRRLLAAVAAWAVTAVCAGAPTGVVEPVGAWRTATADAASLARAVRPFQGAASAEWVEAGRVRFPTRFAGRDALRAAWDVALVADLSRASAFVFDFSCADLSAFSEFRIYFKSGNGWYGAAFLPGDSTASERVRVRRDQFAREGQPDGWNKITAVRFAGSKVAEIDSAFSVGDLSIEDSSLAPALVIRAESHIARLTADGGKDGGIGYFTKMTTKALERCGLAAATVDDTAVTPETLRNRAFVVLPFNPSLPEGVVDQLRDFVRGGGKLLVFYSLAPGVGDLVGVRSRAFARASDFGGPAFAGVARVGAGLAGQPAFAVQRSANALRVEPQKGADIVAVWRIDGRDTDLPAIVRSPTGIYMSHVWFGDPAADGDALLRSMAASLMPDAWRRATAAAARARAVRNRKAARAAGEEIARGGADEFRAFWCHDAYGLPGHTWDEAARLLKAKGFTAVLPNVAWGATAFYPSETLETASAVARKGDALKACLAACRRQGLACHAWKVCWNMGSCVSPEKLDAMVKAGRTQVRADGRRDDRWLCPTHPLNQRAEIAAFLELARLGVDGVHLDYIRYADDDHCFCDGCRTRFEAFAGRTVRDWPGEVKRDAALREKLGAFRRGAIETVVKGVRDAIRRERLSVQLSAATRMDFRACAVREGQDWIAWTKRGWVDFVCPMDYTASPAAFAATVKAQQTAVGNAARVRPGIGLSCWDIDEPLAEPLCEQIKAVRAAGLDGWAIFNFDDIAFRALWCDQPR